MKNTKLHSFKDLNVWQKIADLSVRLYSVTEKFPPSELYGLVNQMRRATISASSNIAEGFKRSHKKEKLQFYRIASSSVTELESQIEITCKLKFLTNNDYRDLMNRVTEVSKMIEGLIKSLNSKSYSLSPDSGFTMIELVVSLGIFVVLVTIAAGGFVQALRAQRQVGALIAANSSVSLTIEQLTREIRTGVDFSLLAPDELTFTNARLEDVTYRLNVDVIERRAIDSAGNDSGFQPITADNVSVKYLGFVFLDDPVNYPPRITISLGISPTESDVKEVILKLQTTASARFL